VTLMVGVCVVIPVTVMVTEWREAPSRRLSYAHHTCKHEGGVAQLCPANRSRS
jgi:hypothetical protein